MAKTRKVILSDDLYRLCNQYQWFTCGTNFQYAAVFGMCNNPEFSLRDIAIAIHICSNGVSLKEIESGLRKVARTINVGQTSTLASQFK